MSTQVSNPYTFNIIKDMSCSSSIMSELDIIPTKPFTNTEYTITLLNESILSNYSGLNVSNRQISKWAYTMPQNNCTVIIGLTNENMIDNTGLVSSSGTAYFAIAPTSYDAETNTSYYSTILALNYNTADTTSGTSEIYVQLHFENSNKMTFYPVLLVPVIKFTMDGQNENGETVENYEYCLYCDGYIKYSNAIHEHGPDVIVNIVSTE